jgi:hypothetical protein
MPTKKTTLKTPAPKATKSKATPPEKKKQAPRKKKAAAVTSKGPPTPCLAATGPAPPEKRKAGRPKRKEQPVTPEKIEQIGELWATGHTREEIGTVIGISRQAVDYHIQRTIKPLWEKSVLVSMGEALAEIDALKRVAWRQFRSDGAAETREQITQQVLEEPSSTEIKLETIEKALTQVKRPGQVAWLHIVQWCIEQRSKMLGHYAPKHHQIDQGTFRVAGMTRDEVNTSMIELLLEKVEEGRQYTEALRASGRLN